MLYAALRIQASPARPSLRYLLPHRHVASDLMNATVLQQGLCVRQVSVFQTRQYLCLVAHQSYRLHRFFRCRYCSFAKQRMWNSEGSLTFRLSKTLCTRDSLSAWAAQALLAPVTLQALRDTGQLAAGHFTTAIDLLLHALDPEDLANRHLLISDVGAELQVILTCIAVVGAVDPFKHCNMCPAFVGLRSLPVRVAALSVATAGFTMSSALLCCCRPPLPGS
jgi:hypothetical protein